MLRPFLTIRAVGPGETLPPPLLLLCAAAAAMYQVCHVLQAAAAAAAAARYQVCHVLQAAAAAALLGETVKPFSVAQL